jgi:DNA-binding response OmpR family regulator
VNPAGAISRPSPSVRVGLIDSDRQFHALLARRLHSRGWHYRQVAGRVRVESLVAMRLTVVVLDLACLAPDGWSYLERLCSTLPELGVVICTGQSSVAQRVRGLGMGADDWVTKPCHPEELIARVEAVIRRRRRADVDLDAGHLVTGELDIRADQFQAFVTGRLLDLTRREFELLRVLTTSAGQVLQRERIYERVWGYSMAGGDRSVDVYVRKLRQKLERRSPRWRYIHTHFGVGYRFEAEALEQHPPLVKSGPEKKAGPVPQAA